MAFKDYIIVMDTEVKSLVHSVNEHIEKGYEPLGGVSFVRDYGSLLLFQSMVLRTIDEPKKLTTTVS